MAHGSSNSCGVAILVKKDVDCTIHSKILDPLGIYVILKATKCMFWSMFMPLTKTQISLNFLFLYLWPCDKITSTKEENIIIGGDFNCPPNPILDKKGGRLIPRKSVVITIENLEEELDLVDIWRVKNPERKSFTWSQWFFVVWITGCSQTPYMI